jgi:DNA-binding SARP family transcriptional activator
MDVGVLGPLRVARDGDALALGGPKQRTVLALLVAGAGRPVSIGALMTGVYGPDAAPSTKRTVHTYIFNLRNELGDIVLT